MDLTNITNTLKNKIITALRNGLTPTSNGTTVMGFSTDATDSFDAYPVIRVIPATIGREVDSLARRYTYTPTYTISIYLNMKDDDHPSGEVIDTLMELVDKVYDVLDSYDFESGLTRCKVLAQSSIISEINTVETKTGTAVFCDIQYPIAVSVGL